MTEIAKVRNLLGTVYECKVTPGTDKMIVIMKQLAESTGTPAQQMRLSKQQPAGTKPQMGDTIFPNNDVYRNVKPEDPATGGNYLLFLRLRLV